MDISPQIMHQINELVKEIYMRVRNIDIIIPASLVIQFQLISLFLYDGHYRFDSLENSNEVVFNVPKTGFISMHLYNSHGEFIHLYITFS